MHPLLGSKPSRHFKVYREEFPAIFRFNGALYQEDRDIDANQIEFVEIAPELAEPWLRVRVERDESSTEQIEACLAIMRNTSIADPRYFSALKRLQEIAGIKESS